MQLGKTNCIIVFLTELEFISVLHVILRTFDLELAQHDYDPALKPDVYPILKTPMMLRVKRRQVETC